MKGSFLKRKRLRDDKRTSVHIDGWESNEFRKTAGIKISGPQSIAGCMVPCQTVCTGIAGNVMGGHDPVTRLEFGNAFPHLGYNSCHFMSQNQRSLFYPVPLQNVASADPTGFGFHNDLADARLRLSCLLQPYVPIVVINRYSHKVH
jgi:hypothetical protein